MNIELCYIHLILFSNLAAVGSLLLSETLLKHKAKRKKKGKGKERKTYCRDSFWNKKIASSVKCLACFFAFGRYSATIWASQVALVRKNPPANAGDLRDVGSIPGLGRSSGEWHGNLLQYSCLEHPMDRGAWQATVHRVTEFSRTETT